MATQKQIEANRKNAQKAGRPKGSKDAKTLEREAIQKAYDQRVFKIANHILNKQLLLANGQTFLYKIEKYYETVGKSKVLRRKPPKLVETQWEIEMFLNGEIESADLNDRDDTYYYMTAKEPNAHVLDSLLDRALGISKKVKDEFGDDEGPVTQIIFIGNDSKTKRTAKKR